MAGWKYLALGELQTLRNLLPPLPRQVLIVVEFLLELKRLHFRVGLASPFHFDTSYTLIGCCFTRVHLYFSFLHPFYCV